jgi:hypothetical protein
MYFMVSKNPGGYWLVLVIGFYFLLYFLVALNLFMDKIVLSSCTYLPNILPIDIFLRSKNFSFSISTVTSAIGDTGVCGHHNTW